MLAFSLALCRLYSSAAEQPHTLRVQLRKKTNPEKNPFSSESPNVWLFNHQCAKKKNQKENEKKLNMKPATDTGSVAEQSNQV